MTQTTRNARPADVARLDARTVDIERAVGIVARLARTDTLHTAGPAGSEYAVLGHQCTGRSFCALMTEPSSIPLAR